MVGQLSSFSQWFVPDNLAPDEQRKRSFLILLQFLLFPTLIYFMVTRARVTGFTTEIGLFALGALCSILLLVSLYYAANMLPFFRIGAAYIAMLVIYEASTGSGEGTAFLWFYFYPLASLFIFGKKEGSWWVFIGTIGIWGVMFLDLGIYHYPSTVSLRFGSSYLVVCLLSYGLEESRARYYKALDAEKVALERALQQVQTLQRLMPICASCKKIRDDTGYWHEVETYMSEQADVQFSHAICPHCTDTSNEANQIV